MITYQILAPMFSLLSNSIGLCNYFMYVKTFIRVYMFCFIFFIFYFNEGYPYLLWYIYLISYFRVIKETFKRLQFRCLNPRLKTQRPQKAIHKNHGVG